MSTSAPHHDAQVAVRPTSPTRIDNETPALAHAWHAVARSEDIDATPVQVELLGEPWALVRIDAQLVAFADRCPHRLAPLSIGTICGSTLQCAYHGWRFDTSGTCVEIPALGPNATIPPRAAARTPYGLTERFGLIWIAPAEPFAGLPEFAEWDDPSFVNAANEPRTTTVSAPQMVDNFLDATHLGTVHAGTFGVEDAAYLPASEIERRGWLAHTTFEVQYRNYDDPLVATGEHPLVQPQQLYKEICGPSTAIVRLFHPLTGKSVSFLFASAPRNRSATTVFKLMTRNDLTDPVEQLPEILGFEDRVLDEDLVLLEAYDEMCVSTDLRTEISTRADRLSVAYRRILAELVSAVDASNQSTNGHP